MEYQVNINYQFMADNEKEAKEKAKQYVSNHLKVQAMPDLVISPLEIALQCKSFRKSKKEHFCVFLLDTQNRIISKEIVSVGTLNASIIHPREVFRTAIIENACSVIVVHNHPSGSLEPSDEDIVTTKRLVDAGKVISIEVLDHVIVTAEAYTSFKERRLI